MNEVDTSTHAPAALQPDGLIRWMSGLADPTRLRLLRLLERHELGVCDLCGVLQMPQSTVSRHLKILADQGWIHGRRRSTANLYRMLLDELEPAQRQFWLLTRDQADGWATFAQDHVRLCGLLDEQRSGAHAFFESAAARWDKTRAERYGASFDRAALTALLPPSWTVADLGCGTGALALELARSVARVIAVDSSQAMLDAAAGRTAEAANIDLRRGDLGSLPLADAEADAAVALLVLTYLPDVNAAITEMARIVRPGGLVVILDLLRHDRDDFRREMGQQSMGFTTGQLTDLLRQAGFVTTTCTALPPDPDATGPALLVARGLRPEA